MLEIIFPIFWLTMAFVMWLIVFKWLYIHDLKAGHDWDSNDRWFIITIGGFVCLLLWPLVPFAFLIGWIISRYAMGPMENYESEIRKRYGTHE